MFILTVKIFEIFNTLLIFMFAWTCFLFCSILGEVGGAVVVFDYLLLIVMNANEKMNTYVILVDVPYVVVMMNNIFSDLYILLASPSVYPN